MNRPIGSYATYQPARRVRKARLLKNKFFFEYHNPSDTWRISQAQTPRKQTSVDLGTLIPNSAPRTSDTISKQRTCSTEYYSFQGEPKDFASNRRGGGENHQLERDKFFKLPGRRCPSRAFHLCRTSLEGAPDECSAEHLRMRW